MQVSSQLYASTDFIPRKDVPLIIQLVNLTGPYSLSGRGGEAKTLLPYRTSNLGRHISVEVSNEVVHRRSNC